MYDSMKDTKQHIAQVVLLIDKVITLLEDRKIKHDRSKLDEFEKSAFDEFTPKLARSTYGSEEYKDMLSEMKPALEHHYEHNRHHPEHFKKYVCIICFKEFDSNDKYCDVCGNGYLTKEESVGIDRMTLIDIIEMLCDWKAATLRHDNGDIIKSIEINRKRFKISDQLANILINTVKYLEMDK